MRITQNPITKLSDYLIIHMEIKNIIRSIIRSIVSIRIRSIICSFIQFILSDPYYPIHYPIHNPLFYPIHIVRSILSNPLSDIPYAQHVMANDLANNHLPTSFQHVSEPVPGHWRLPSLSNTVDSNTLSSTGPDRLDRSLRALISRYNELVAHIEAGRACRSWSRLSH